MARRAAEGAERVVPASLAAWRGWRALNHTRPDSIWLVLGKGAAAPLAQTDAVEEALCWGWIDSRPRRPRSPWSGLNKRRIARIETEARLRPPGLAAIAAARADGSWDSCDAAEALDIPPDLAAALAGVAGAQTRWDGFAPSARKGILWSIASAGGAATRARRVAETARLAGAGLRANFPEARPRA